MKKLLIMLTVLVVFVGLVWSAGEVVYTRGNTEALSRTFVRFYVDSVIQKGDSTTRTINVPDSKIGYNLKIWLTDPYTREESLTSAIWVNSLKPIENTAAIAKASEAILDFGYDNKADTFYFYGIFSSFELTTWTGTAGADADDSSMCWHYSFSGMK